MRKKARNWGEKSKKRRSISGLSLKLETNKSLILQISVKDKGQFHFIDDNNKKRNSC